MQRIPAIAVLFLLLAGTGFYCRREKPLTAPATLTGKLITNGPCGNYVIQVLSGKVDPSRIVASWKPDPGDTTYTNVFKVANVCNFEGSSLAKNDIFTFRMNDTVIVNNCMVCEIYVPTPPIANTVDHVQKVN